MTDKLAAALKRARETINTGVNTTYPSRAAAGHVRAVMQALVDAVEEQSAAIDRYRYAWHWWAADSFDGSWEMRARFTWARGEDVEGDMTADEVARVGNQFLERSGRVPRS